MPMPIGIAMTSAMSDDSSVTASRSRMPNRRFAASLVTKSGLVRKLALLASSDGTAWTTRKRPIRTIAATTTRPDPVVSPRNTRSPVPPLVEPGGAGGRGLGVGHG